MPSTVKMSPPHVSNFSHICLSSHFRWKPVLYATKEFIKALRSICVGDMSKFVSELDKEVHKDDTSDLVLPIEERLCSVERIEFVKQVWVFCEN